MHPRSPLLNIGGTVLKEFYDLDILGVTFDSNMTYEKNLRSVSRAASQGLGIFRKSRLVFHDRLLLGRCFRGFILPVLENCSAMWCRLQIHTLVKIYISWNSYIVKFICREIHMSVTSYQVMMSLLFNWRCMWVWHCSSLICDSIMYAV